MNGNRIVETEGGSDMTIDGNKLQGQGRDVPTQGSGALFALFPHFPWEIRRKIWVHALPGPRIVNLKDFWLATDGTPNNPNNSSFSISPVPTLLQVCYESREVALKYFKLSFGTEHASPTVYFDFANDYLFINGINHCPCFQYAQLLTDCPDFGKVRKMVLGLEPDTTLIELRHIVRKHGDRHTASLTLLIEEDVEVFDSIHEYAVKFLGSEVEGPFKSLRADLEKNTGLRLSLALFENW